MEKRKRRDAGVGVTPILPLTRRDASRSLAGLAPAGVEDADQREEDIKGVEVERQRAATYSFVG